MFDNIALIKKLRECLVIFIGLLLFSEMSFSAGNCIKGDCDNGIGTWTNSKDGIEGEYAGEFKNGYFNGHGVFTLTNGGKYIGEWKDGVFVHGQGIAIYPNGSKYVGDFKNDKKDGYGTLTHAEGFILEGEWKDDYLDGQGIHTEKNGNSYIGSFKKSMPNGEGIYIKPDGTLISDGIWKDGVLKELQIHTNYTTRYMPLRDSNDRVIGSTVLRETNRKGTGSTLSQGSTLGKPE